jgi:hypothetical protein
VGTPRLRTEVGGLARYRGDDYHAGTLDGDRVPGNPWFLNGPRIWSHSALVTAVQDFNDRRRALSSQADRAVARAERERALHVS